MGVADVFRTEWPRLVATLMRDVGDLTIEDAAQDAFIEASTRWPTEGVPERPGAWLVTTERRKAIDQIRRMRRFEDRLPALAADVATVSSDSTESALSDPDSDAMIKSSSPTRNYGSDTTLRNRSGSPEWRTLLAFDVHGLSGTVTKATVRLFVNDPLPAAGSISAISTAWTESSVNWSNAPDVNGGPIATVGAVSNGTWAEWDVTAAIERNGSFAFALVSDSTDSVIFDSRENSSGNAPQLVITTDG